MHVSSPSTTNRKRVVSCPLDQIFWRSHYTVPPSVRKVEQSMQSWSCYFGAVMFWGAQKTNLVPTRTRVMTALGMLEYPAIVAGADIFSKIQAITSVVRQIIRLLLPAQSAAVGTAPSDSNPGVFHQMSWRVACVAHILCTISRSWCDSRLTFRSTMCCCRETRNHFNSCLGICNNFRTACIDCIQRCVSP